VTTDDPATKVATSTQDPTNKVSDPQAIKQALVAELTWAKLYTKTMNKDLGVIATAIDNDSRPTINEPEMQQSAAKLHDELQIANRTVGELSDHAGVRPAVIKK